LESIKDSLSKKLYIHCEECKLNDGSGLSRRNLVTARSLTNLLIDVYKSDFKDNFINSLAIAGIDGTLRKRFRSNSTVSNIRAKTGTLRNASGLAGFVKTLEGENIAFAFIFNGNDVGYYKSLENQLAELLANFYIDYSKK